MVVARLDCASSCSCRIPKQATLGRGPASEPMFRVAEIDNVDAENAKIEFELAALSVPCQSSPLHSTLNRRSFQISTLLLVMTGTAVSTKRTLRTISREE